MRGTNKAVIEKLNKDVSEIREIVMMHLRSHIADYEPVNVISMEGTTENGISYHWGNYYRTKINTKKVQPEQTV